MNLQVNYSDIIDAREKLMKDQEVYFLQEILFSWRWWLLIIIAIILWLIWIWLVDKTRVFTILFVGLSTSMIATHLDDIGLSLMLWAYPYGSTPYLDRLSLVDLSVLPVAYMLLYQYVKTWGKYMFVLVVLTLFAVFVAEPVFEKMQLYMMMNWKHVYSTPFYIAIGVFMKWLTDALEKVIQKNRHRHR